MKLYEASPAFAELYPMLDAPDARYKVWKELQGEYRTGYFGFILRDAAQTIGKFDSAETADAYFSQLGTGSKRLCRHRQGFRPAPLRHRSALLPGRSARHFPLHR